MCGLVYGLGDILAIRISLPPAPEAESLWATGGGEGLIVAAWWARPGEAGKGAEGGVEK